MEQPDWAGPLTAAYQQAVAYLSDLPRRPVGPTAGPRQLRAALDGPLPEIGGDPRDVIDALSAAVDPGLMASAGGRFFGFVIGGATPAALAADWLTAAWDQNAALYAAAPAAAVAEEVTGRWLRELLGLPENTSVGFVTGAQMANFTGLAAARHEVLRRAGWDAEAAGLAGAPAIRVLVGQERHDTIDRAARFLGLGTNAIIPVDADAQGRMLPAALAPRLAEAGGPTIICAQVGHINTGAVDPVGDICRLAQPSGAWVHVDGAFGLWAAASPRLLPLLAGVELADSWATDAHKWLNVPYDSGLVFCAHPEAHRAAMGLRATYLPSSQGGERDPYDFNPELSRRARAFCIYAAIRSLGRQGVTEIVDRCCELARRFAAALARQPGVEVLNEVALNQVLARFPADDGDHDGRTHRVIARVQNLGMCWMGGTTWRGQTAMRISVSNWSTDEHDVDLAVDAIARSVAAERRQDRVRRRGQSHEQSHPERRL